ncbi:MAG TPA: neutral/alkaline non-lysosomal ceramidase N-terminal domain-containing protein, partial [Pseudomonadota bacterium]|nr:neutral/alkaline non-lysosomal ceramidase N-terminal domain-containing protein [Pseudomonadota bacterium]
MSLCWSRAVLSCSFSLLVLSVCGCATPQEVTQTAVPPPQLALDEIPLQITQRCPGDPACPDEGDGRLYAGFAKRDVTPQIEPFTDTNGNGVYDDGEPYEDKNKNGTFDAYWIAGYDSGRLATGVNDPVWARALALRQNQTTVVVVAVDTLGLFRDEFDYVNKLIDKRLGIDLLLLHGTHVHETADLTGGWGPDDFTNGVNNAYRQKVHQAIADAATEAVANLRPARMTLGSIKVQDPDGNMKRYVFDSRDPVVINNVLHTMQFLDVSTTPPQPITTLVNWSNHPEAAGSKNKLISSDFVHYLRQELEQKGAGPVVYVSGSIGG